MTAVALAQVTAALQSAGLLHDLHGELPWSVTGITDDSRAVTPGSLFVAVHGTSNDGHDFIAAAAERGATAAIVGDASRSMLPALVVNNTRRAAAVAAAAYYNAPARALTVVGVTGTNGKTTTVGLLRHVLDDPDTHAASVGTLGVLIGSSGRAMPGVSSLTTPGAIELQRILRHLADQGVRNVAIEASSHALDQHRLDDIGFAAGVFTNFTRDHLDYHGTMDAYHGAKLRLLPLVKHAGFAVVNSDDHAWDALVNTAERNTVTFGMAMSAGVRASSAHYASRGSSWTLHENGNAHDVRLPLVGDFNVINALGAAAAAIALGRDPVDVAARLATAPQVSGRLERLADLPVVLRDYAHTPDALERALTAVRPFAAGRVVVVFGCGGDRDPGKRPIMGSIAERLADHVILTSDNPRTENPEHILDEIESGMMRHSHERIEDRREAIARALAIARSADDLILLAGKGHETYQIRGTEKLPFDEAVVVRELMSGTG